MRHLGLSGLLAVTATLMGGATPLLAASNYFETWDSGTTAGWNRGTIKSSGVNVAQDHAGTQRPASRDRRC